MNPEKLIQSYVTEKYFISTAYRQCSAVENPVWFYETIVFNWDKEMKKTCGIVDIYDSGSTPENALVEHGNICLHFYLKKDV